MKRIRINRINRINRRAQGVLEYVIILVVAAIAVMAMTIYFRRGIQAAVKVAADELGSQSDTQTDPNKGTTTESNTTSIPDITHVTSTTIGGGYIDQINSKRRAISDSTSVSKRE